VDKEVQCSFLQYKVWNPDSFLGHDKWNRTTKGKKRVIKTFIKIGVEELSFGNVRSD
jgi:hypothetical protein